MKSTSPVFLLLALALLPILTKCNMPQWAACMAACQASLLVCLRTYAFHGTSPNLRCELNWG